MAAPTGNTFWTLRTKHGANPKFEDADALWKACCEYFVARESLLWNKQPLPFTQESLCLDLGISQETWIKWRKDRDDLSEVITRVDSIIRDQKMTGAIVGAYNHNIIARDLGLSDKQDVTANVVTEVKRQIVGTDNQDR